MFEEIVKAQELITAIMETLSPVMQESCACMLCDEIAKRHGRKAEEVADEVRDMVYTINAQLGAY